MNSLNQYTNVTTDGNPAVITHDQNGNLTGDSVNSFTYDAENKLLTAAMGGGANVSYTYDPIGRRASKTVDGVATEYVYDGTHVIAEYDGSGNVLRRYVHGPGTDRPIAMVEGDAGSGYSHSYYHADRKGSVVALTDDSGAPVAHYTYDAYGIPYLVDPATGAQTQVAAGQPYLFTGRRFDFETGLYYYRARTYSASLGRFLQTDPIGYEDQMNLYAYVGNDPVNGSDPTGKCPWCLVGAAIGIVLQTAREVSSDSFKDGIFSKEGVKALARIGISGAVGAVTGGLGGVVTKSAVGLAFSQAAKTVTSNALKNSAIAAATAAAGKLASNTTNVTIDAAAAVIESDGNPLVAVLAVAEVESADLLEGTGDAALAGAEWGAAGSVFGDGVSLGLGISKFFGESGTLSTAGAAVGSVASNTVGNLTTSDVTSAKQDPCQKDPNACSE